MTEIAIGGVVIGIFVLASQTSILGQIIGFLILESGIVFNEIVNHHHLTWEIQLGLSLIYLWTALVLVKFFKQFSSVNSTPSEELSQSLEEKEVL